VNGENLSYGVGLDVTFNLSCELVLIISCDHFSLSFGFFVKLRVLEKCGLNNLEFGDKINIVS